MWQNPGGSSQITVAKPHCLGPGAAPGPPANPRQTHHPPALCPDPTGGRTQLLHRARERTLDNSTCALVEKCGWNSLKSYYESEKKFLGNRPTMGIERIWTCLCFNNSILRGFCFGLVFTHSPRSKERKRTF